MEPASTIRRPSMKSSPSFRAGSSASALSAPLSAKPDRDRRLRPVAECARAARGEGDLERAGPDEARKGSGDERFHLRD